MGKARSFRLTPENEIRFFDLVRISQLDNPNKVFNELIENYYLYKKNERLIQLLKELKQLLKTE